jgi:hypothetical protein
MNDTLHSDTLHYTPINYTTRHTLLYTARHTQLQDAKLHYTPERYFSQLPYTKPHYTNTEPHAQRVGPALDNSYRILNGPTTGHYTTTYTKLHYTNTDPRAYPGGLMTMPR